LLVAVHLLRSGFRGGIAIIEPRARLGLGLAYSTPFDQHLLNVPAGKMSALAREPAHFVEWLQSNHWPHAEADSFAPRKFYGEYLQDLLHQTLSAHGQTNFLHIRAEAASIHIDEGLARLELSDGTALCAERVVLALGNPASASDPGIIRTGMEGHWHLSPWFDDALGVRFKGEKILVIGTGLTAVDSVLALKGQSGTCEIVMLSRRGLLPLVHDLRVSSRKLPPLQNVDKLRLMFRELRSYVEVTGQTDPSWRTVVDGLRPVSNDIWKGLSVDDQARFLRHLKTYWEPHRHRMAPEIHARLNEYRTSGGVRIVAGRILGMQFRGHTANVRILLKNGGEREISVNRIISCTGIQENYAQASRSLIRSLIESGLARANHVALGFQTDSHGALLNETSVLSPILFTLGPPRRGELFETTAVPEIRVQAGELAHHLLRLRWAGGV